MTHFLDKVPYDFADPVARSMRDVLATYYFREDKIIDFVQASGINPGSIAWTQTAQLTWADTLRQGSLQGKNRKLVEVIIASADAAVASRLQEFLAAVPVGPAPEPPADWKAPAMSKELERQTAAEPTLLDVTFLERGMELAHAVVRLLVAMPDGNRYYGTGFLIAPDLVLTNHHVLFDLAGNEERARRVEVWFGYERSFGGNIRAHSAIEGDPATIQGNREHDWAVIRVNATDVPKSAVVIDLNELGEVGVDDRVNIIQHPKGGPKQIGMVHNVVRLVNEDVVQYLTDTEPGSSGSPVFDEQWRIVALHHQGREVTVDGVTEIRNQGRRITRVVAGLTAAGLR